jgi:hypothetical protein
MQTRLNRFGQYTRLGLICLVILFGGSACGQQPSTAITSPVASTAELAITPLPSQQPTFVPNAPVEFKLIPHSEDAQLTADIDGKTAIIKIFSQGGVSTSNADVEIISEKLPQRIILQFHLRGLESLRFAYDKTEVSVSLSNGEHNDVFESVVREDDATVSGPITSDSPYWMKLRVVSTEPPPVPIPLQEGYIEVEIPSSFFAGENHQFSIEWIDFSDR